MALDLTGRGVDVLETNIQRTVCRAQRTVHGDHGVGAREAEIGTYFLVVTE